MKKDASKVFVKVELKRKNEQSVEKPKNTNGQNMNC
jgi:hypothetical protein